jgi:hypothetical protein
MWHAWETGDLREREHLEDISINGGSGMGRQGQDLTG